jgi:hypothetical protein
MLTEAKKITNDRYLSTPKGKIARTKSIRNYNKSENGKTKNRAIKISSPEQFIRYKMGSIRAKSKEKGLQLNIDVEYLISIYKEQQGRCRICNVQMTHVYGELTTISIDRIDSDIGYIKGNVQLVCRAINLAKQHLPNQSIIEFIQKVRENA